MKSAVIIFHRDIDRYNWEWIEKCYQTILQQSYQDFTVFELDYGGTDRQTFPNSVFYSVEMPTHAHAHNFLLDEVFKQDFDCAFNVNVDDWYALNRFELQIPWIEKGYDVVSSNFYRVNEDESMKQSFFFEHRDIKKEAFEKNHNVLAHPVLCYSRNFWLNCDKLDPKDIPFDDFILWKKSYRRDCFRFIVLPEFLLFQRIHDCNVSKRK